MEAQPQAIIMVPGVCKLDLEAPPTSRSKPETRANASRERQAAERTRLARIGRTAVLALAAYMAQSSLVFGRSGLQDAATRCKNNL